MVVKSNIIIRFLPFLVISGTYSLDLEKSTVRQSIRKQELFNSTPLPEALILLIDDYVISETEKLIGANVDLENFIKGYAIAELNRIEFYFCDPNESDNLQSRTYNEIADRFHIIFDKNAQPEYSHKKGFFFIKIKDANTVFVANLTANPSSIQAPDSIKSINVSDDYKYFAIHTTNGRIYIFENKNVQANSHKNLCAIL